MYKINLYENLRSPKNPNVIPIDRYVDFIKEGINETQVLTARVHGKGTKLYDRIKANRYCVTHNFLYNGYKSDDNIISSTGLLYYDVDSSIDFSQLDTNKIFIHHKSLGGIGSSIIVKANDITVDNFDSNYQSIAKELGIESLIDNNASKKSQFTVISYDKDVYYNPNSYVFTASTENLSFSSNISSSVCYLPRNDRFLNNKFRITNASDFVANDNEYEVFPNGVITAKVNIPRNIPQGNRTKVLMAIIQQIVALNPFSLYQHTLNRALGINQIFTKHPLSEKEVIGIVDSIIKYRDNKTITPINNHIRKVIFKGDSQLSRAEKTGIVNKEIGAIRTNITKRLIHDAIENWDKPEKIIAQKIAIITGKGIATINRHWKEFKEIVNEYNKNRN